MYTLHHGDCLDVLPTLADQSVDAVICDPPYGTTACKWDSVIPFEPMWKELKRIIKPRGAIVLFGSQPFTSALVMSNPKWFKYCWTWDKVTGKGHLVAKKRPLQQTEDIAVFCNSGIRYFPIMEKREKPIKGVEAKRSVIMGGNSKGYSAIYTHKYPKTILRFIPVNNPIHPTQKPLALLEYLVKTYTNEGDTVVDFTFGSNTTGVACVQTGRNYIGIERDADYFRIGSERIRAAADPLHAMREAS